MLQPNHQQTFSEIINIANDDTDFLFSSLQIESLIKKCFKLPQGVKIVIINIIMIQPVQQVIFSCDC